MHYQISDLHELEIFAKNLMAQQHPRDEATLILLSGDLGAGKTSLVQACARALGLTEAITSPTFVIQKSYPLEGQLFSKLLHIDAYRLDGQKDLLHLGWEDQINDPTLIIFLEWPEMVAGLPFPKSFVHLNVRITETKGRDIQLEEK